MEIISLLAAHPKLVALDRCLHHELADFYCFNEAPCERHVDSFAQNNFLPRLAARKHGFFFFHTAYVDAPLCEFLAKDIQHLLKLKIRLCREREQLPFKLKL